MIDRGRATSDARGELAAHEGRRQGGTQAMAIEVAKVELKTVQDASGLEACIARASSPPTR